MSSLEKRLAVFRQLPLRGQLATITASKSNKILNQKPDYIASLEKIHADCLAVATEQEKITYQKAKCLLES